MTINIARGTKANSSKVLASLHKEKMEVVQPTVWCKNHLLLTKEEDCVERVAAFCLLGST